jgi:hypothetical protein
MLLLAGSEKVLERIYKAGLSKHFLPKENSRLGGTQVTKLPGLQGRGVFCFFFLVLCWGLKPSSRVSVW